MKPKSMLLLVLALGCGLVASIGISQVLERRNGGPVVETKEIYVAASDIGMNERLSEELLEKLVKLEPWPVEKIPQGAITDQQKLVDKRARTKIFAGDVLLEQKFTDKNSSVIEELPPGYRVSYVPVDASSGALLIRPGDRVDVQWSYNRNPDAGLQSSGVRTILEDIRVFATDSQSQRMADDDTARITQTVSLMVTPEQAHLLTLASRHGEIRLLPRHPDDKSGTLAGAGDVTLEDIFGTTQQGDRENERESVDDSKEEDNDPAATPSLPNTLAGQPQVEEDEPFRMVLFEGSNRREITFDPRTSQPREGGALPSFANPLQGHGTLPPSGRVAPAPQDAPAGDFTDESQDDSFFDNFEDVREE